MATAEAEQNGLLAMADLEDQEDPDLVQGAVQTLVHVAAAAEADSAAEEERAKVQEVQLELMEDLVTTAPAESGEAQESEVMHIPVVMEAA